MKIAVFGAGSIGAYLGGALLAAGADAVLIGRARMGERMARHGLLLTDLHGSKVQLAPEQIPYSQEAASLAGADLILVTVKSADTATAAEAIRVHAKSSALVLSLQNGIGNAELLRDKLPDFAVIGGMVPFNVVQMDGGRLHRGTPGEMVVEVSPWLAPYLPVFAQARIPLRERDDFLAVQWGKLLINLNNPVNALADVPLREEFSQRAYRRCLALLMEEALAVLHTAGITPAKVLRIAPHVLPRVLRLPDFLFKRVAGAMLRIDPEARSSMWEDLKAGRRTEIDYLNGAVAALAASLGKQAPANQRIVELIRAAEEGATGAIDGKALYRALKSGPGKRTGMPLSAAK